MGRGEMSREEMWREERAERRIGGRRRRGG